MSSLVCNDWSHKLFPNECRFCHKEKQKQLSNINTETAPIGSRLGIDYVRSLKETLSVKVKLSSHYNNNNNNNNYSNNDSNSKNNYINNDNITNDNILTLNIQQSTVGPLAISSVVWDAGLYLTDYLVYLDDIVGQNVLGELK